MFYVYMCVCVSVWCSVGQKKQKETELFESRQPALLVPHRSG